MSLGGESNVKMSGENKLRQENKQPVEGGSSIHQDPHSRH